MHQHKQMTETIIGLTMEKFKPVEVRHFVDADSQNKIYQAITNPSFLWTYDEDVTAALMNSPAASTPTFNHLIFDQNRESNPYYEFVDQLIAEIEKQFKLSITDMLDIRAEFLLNTKYPIPSLPYKHNTPHKDYDTDHFVVVYYVNETDGETVVFNETAVAEKYYPMHRCMPEKGKALLFSGVNFYADTCPKVHTKRIALTFKFKAERL